LWRHGIAPAPACSRSANGRRLKDSQRRAEAEIGWMIDLVNAIRSLRAEMNITATPLALIGPQTTRARGGRWTDFLKRSRGVGHRIRDGAAAGSCSSLCAGGCGAALKAIIDSWPSRRGSQRKSQGRGRHQARRCQARQSRVVRKARKIIEREGKREKPKTAAQS